MRQAIECVFVMCVTVFLTSFGYAQKYKKFEGVIFYDVFFQATPDSIPYKVNYLTIRVKDSLVRIDTNSDSFGAQTTIRNIQQKKSYVLLKSNDKYYAVRQHDEEGKTANYSFKKIPNKHKINGFTAKRILRIDASNKLDTVSYFPKLNPIYLNYNKQPKGLLAEYSVEVTETSKLIYRVVQIEEKELDRKLFQVPSFFQVITLDAFILEQQNK